MKLMWLGYLVYRLGNCVMKLCIETGLKHLGGVWHCSTNSAPQTLLHKLHYRVAPQKTGVRGVPL